MKKPRRKKCKECNNLFTPSYSSLQVCCSTKCAIAYSKKKKEYTKKELEKGFIERKQRASLESLKKSVANTCHLYIRLRDANKPCISCGIPYKKDFDAGHFYSAGKFSNLKYNEYNINGQCIQCNRMNEGMHESYRLYLVEKIGHEELDELDRLASEYMKTDFKWNREELLELRNYYKEKIMQLKTNKQ